jgi:COP9 signalosome complex subunit 6
LNLKFRELPYSVETGEAEMISVDFVARGGGNATAVDGTAKKATKGQASQAPVGDLKSMADSGKKEVNGVDSSLLSPEDEERMLSFSLYFVFM